MEIQEFEKIVRRQEGALSSAFPALMRKVYVWMTLALAITGICAYGVATSPALLQLIYMNRAAIWILLFAELGLVFYTTARINHLSLTTATTLFILYSAINGVTLSAIFLAYTLTSIASVFFITAGTFAATALYGYSTKRDLSKLGGILFMALIGLILPRWSTCFSTTACSTSC